METTDDFPMMMEREFGMPPDCPPVAVAFGPHPMRDPKKSKEAGHDVFKDVEHVRIAVPGDRNSLLFQPATDTHRKRFPLAYEAFKNREKAPREGQPIEQWAPISRGQALTLRAANIDTVEALAAVHDGLIDKLGSNARELRAKAQAFLKQATDSAAIMAEAEEKEALQRQIRSLQEQIIALGGKPPAEAAPTPVAEVEKDAASAARKPRKATKKAA